MEARDHGVSSQGRADLHVHSAHSDGLRTVPELVRLAQETGLVAIALTDHDTVAGVEEIIEEAGSAGIEVVPGVELSTNYKGCDLHLLGYFVDHRDRAFLDALEEFRRERQKRAERIVGRLADLGVPLDWEDVLASGGGTLGRPHIARALVARGVVGEVEEAFQLYLGPGKPGYVERYKFDTLEAIRMVREAGGLAVLAHPGIARQPALVEELAAGELDGLEVHHPRNDPEAVDRLGRLVRENRLLATGGSDYHGDPDRPGEVGMGGCTVTYETVEALRNRAGSRVP